MTLSRMMASLLLMTLAAWLLLACVSPASTSPAGERGTRKFHPKCPAEDGPVPVYIADPKDCHVYYECSNGIPEKQTCPTYLEWDPSLHVCVTPKQSPCHKKSKG